jgi:RNA polymerase-binding transcription factor DksA
MKTSAQVRSELVARLAALRERADRIHSHQRNTDEPPPSDWEELASFRENDEVVDALDGFTTRDIAMVERAIERIDAGTWGTCARCDEKIEPARLEALPVAALCLSCTQTLEAKR